MAIHRCLLKDVWRLDGFHPEGEVYQRLHEHRLRKIPQVLAAGDIGNHCCGFFPDEWLANVHHHDISVGNIIIVRKSDGSSVGYLIDWEFAKFSEDVGAGAHEKTVSTICA
jgi:thiamine kinase-like enzyme